MEAVLADNSDSDKTGGALSYFFLVWAEGEAWDVAVFCSWSAILFSSFGGFFKVKTRIKKIIKINAPRKGKTGLNFDILLRF